MTDSGKILGRLGGFIQGQIAARTPRPEIPIYTPVEDTDPAGFGEPLQVAVAERAVPATKTAPKARQSSGRPANRLDRSESAGGGWVRDRDGRNRPHYHGHRARLRERFLAGGHAPMPEYELLELLLFNAIERIDVKPLAKRLLAEFGDLNGVVAASRSNVLRVDGATEKVWLQLRIAEAFAQRMSRAKVLDRDVLSSWDDVITYCRTTMAHRKTEQFRVLFLDRKNVVIADEAQGEGTVDHVPVYPREVARRALELSASALLIVHNHPSGDPTPSEADIEMTLRLEAACGALGLVIHDHIIIGKDRDLSFRSERLMGLGG